MLQKIAYFRDFFTVFPTQDGRGILMSSYKTVKEKRKKNFNVPRVCSQKNTLATP